MINYDIMQKRGEKMKIATVGTSWITASFISACIYAGDTEITYSYSRNIAKANEFCKKNKTGKPTDSLETIANDSETQFVYIASPNKLHYEQSKYFLSKGKNVICEKPATTTAEQYIELINMAESKNLFYVEAIMSIHTPSFALLKLAMSTIGKIKSANLNFCQLSSKYISYCNGENPNIFNPELHTGCLMDIGVYNIYIAAALFGMPDKIISDAVFMDSGADCCGNAILKYPDKTVTLNYSKVAQGFSASEIYGDVGTVTIESVSQLTGINLVSKDNRNEIVSPLVPRDEVMSGEINYIKQLTDNDSTAIEKYNFATETAKIVRRITDEIRKQNNFSF